MFQRGQFLSGSVLSIVWCLFPAIAWGADEAIINLTNHPVTIVCLGDRVTGVYYHTDGQRAYPEMLEIAIAEAVPHTRVKVINASVGGHSTSEGLTRLEADVFSHHPDVVTISLGLNDMVRVPEDQFRTNLETLIARCQAAQCQVVLCTPNSIITIEGRPIETLRNYCDVIRQVGTARGVPVCDQFAVAEALREKDPWEWRLTLSDEIHLNMDGHKLMAEELCRTFTGQSISLTDVQPPPHPLAKTQALLNSGQPIKVLAMPPFDALDGPALRLRYPDAVIDVTTWPTDGKTLSELEATANQIVRAMKPNLVILAVPRSAAAESDEQFVRSYSWVMNWSLSFGHTEWD